MWKRLAITGAALVSLAVGALTAAAPANADSTIDIRTGGTVAGTGHFKSLGEIFTACDTKTDGKGIRIDWYVVANRSNSGSVWDGDGNNGHCATQNASIAEGREIAYRLCFTDNGTTPFCTEYFNDYA